VDYFGLGSSLASYAVYNSFTYTEGVASQYYNNTVSNTIPAGTLIDNPLVGTRVFGVFGVSYNFQSGGAGSPVTKGGGVKTLAQRRARITSVSPVVISEDNGWRPKTPIEMYVFGSFGVSANATFLGWADLPTVARGPRTRLTSGVVIYRYCVGLSAATINAQEKLQIVSSAGSITDTILTSTEPNLARWREMVNNSEQFISQDSEISRWMGDIYEVATTYAPAKM
jgi:hypothetical protein